MNKREFVIGGAALAASAAWVAAQATEPPGCASATAVAALPDLEREPGLRAWQGHLHQRFDIVGADQAQGLVLERVDARGFEGPAEQFSLLFAVAGQAVPAGTFAVRDATGRLVDLHLQTAGTGTDGRALLRADFNRLL